MPVRRHPEDLYFPLKFSAFKLGILCVFFNNQTDKVMTGCALLRKMFAPSFES
ncbi:hypothetical protein [Priestia endophytica]|uniref:hypothetical protein n=1 Tax=Priestia endophytica TaxID=135735 RepID=UPI001623C90B|nr:hypothetical protein [Priestia endophytica]